MNRIPYHEFILHGSPVPDPIDESLEGKTISTSYGYFCDKKAILFGLPGAFTPTCTNEMLPTYDILFDKFKKEFGIDAIYCTSVNDDYVMEAWAKSLDIKNVEMIPDGNASFAKAMNMCVRMEHMGFGLRSWRYSAYVDDGEIVLMLPEDGMENNLALDEYDISSPEYMYEQLKKLLS